MMCIVYRRPSNGRRMVGILNISSCNSEKALLALLELLSLTMQHALYRTEEFYVELANNHLQSTEETAKVSCFAWCLVRSSILL